MQDSNCLLDFGAPWGGLWIGKPNELGTHEKYKAFVKDHRQRPLPKDYLKSSAKWSLLQVKIVRRISRSQLFAPIDSLSVYRYLNSGTFRAIHRIGATRRRAQVRRF